MKKPYAKIAKYLLFVIILAGLLAPLIPRKGGTSHRHRPISAANWKLKKLYHLSEYKSHAGNRLIPIQSLEDLFDVEGFDPDLLTTYSRITGQETRVAHNPPQRNPWQYHGEDILFYFEDPIDTYFDETGMDEPPLYMAITRGGNVVTLTHHPMRQPPAEATAADPPTTNGKAPAAAAP